MDRESVAQRFQAKTDRRGPDECWPWLDSPNSSGYGKLWIDGRCVAAHRLAWLLSRGSIPPGSGPHGTCVLHTCDNPICVNPAHLFLGTQGDNAHDMSLKERGSKTKLNWLKVRKIRRDYEAGGVTIRSLARREGVSTSAIQLILDGTNWKEDVQK